MDKTGAYRISTLRDAAWHTLDGVDISLAPALSRAECAQAVSLSAIGRTGSRAIANATLIGTAAQEARMVSGEMAADGAGVATACASVMSTHHAEAMIRADDVHASEVCTSVRRAPGQIGLTTGPEAVVRRHRVPVRTDATLSSAAKARLAE